MVLEIEVRDEVVQQLGKERLRDLVQAKIEAEEFRIAAEEIRKSMDEAATNGVDWDAEFEQARLQAWEEYKQKRGRL